MANSTNYSWLDPEENDPEVIIAYWEDHTLLLLKSLAPSTILPNFGGRMSDDLNLVFYNEANRIIEEQHGSDSLIAIETQMLRADALQRHRSYKEAVTAYSDVIAKMDRLTNGELGINPRLRTRIHRALSLACSGEFDEAREEIDDVLDYCLPRLGDLDALTLEARVAQAQIEDEDKQFAKACEYYRSTWEFACKAFGEDDEHSLKILELLILSERQIGNVEEAKKLVSLGWKTCEASLGYAHRLTEVYERLAMKMGVPPYNK